MGDFLMPEPPTRPPWLERLAKSAAEPPFLPVRMPLAPPRLPKRRVFISYHHGLDQCWYGWMAEHFCERFDLFTNRSLDERIHSRDFTYVQRVIREDHIDGTSITLVLCGENTWKRKHIDGEIRSTLLRQHAAMGLILPTAPVRADGTVWVPRRLYANYQTGYAPVTNWTWDVSELERWIEAAIVRPKNLIDNSMALMDWNLP